MKIRKVGKYELQSVIGEGSFGKVYMGVAEGSTEKVALKCITKKNRPSKQINNIKSETELLKNIKHENVIAMKECFETETQLIIVMEYAGADLSKLLEKERKISEDKVRFFGKQILSAMLHLHQLRILHRDLKPQNILLHNDQIKICDFGFAKKMSASTNFLMSIKGTPLYIAPQILQGAKYTHKVDIWSLGVILYELAAGKTPFYAHTLQQLQPKILHQTVKYPPTMSTSLKQLIDGMLQKNPTKRYDWDQVKNHKFFITQSPSLTATANEVNIFDIDERPKIPLKWNCSQQCAQMMRKQTQFTAGRLQIRDLKYNQGFCFSVTHLLGECCVDRSKIPKEVLLKTLILVSKMAMSKPDPTQNLEADIARNKILMTAVITLGTDQSEEDLLSLELEIIGFLLKQNFDGIKIDTDCDEDITNLISQQLKKPCTKFCANLCFKLFGILTNQAITALAQSEQFFSRLAEEKLLTAIAQKYSSAPQSAIVLECLQKCIHPRLQRTSRLNHKTKSLFKTLKEEAAIALLKNGLIGDQSPLQRKWLKNSDLQVYCSILFECLSVSRAVRNEFIKKTYWYELLSNSKTKLYYIAYCYIILRESGVYLLSSEIIQNQIVSDHFDNKLCNAYLLYFAFTTLFSKLPLSKSKLQKIKNLIFSLKNLLFTTQQFKINSCKQLLGFFSQDSKYIDTILIDVLHKVLKDLHNSKQEQEMFIYCKNILEEIIKLPLSEHSLLQVCELYGRVDALSDQQVKGIDNFFLDLVKNQGFQDYLIVNPSQCTALLTKLLEFQNLKLTDDKQVVLMAELLEKYQLLRLILSEKVLNQELYFAALKVINKTIVKLKSIEFLVNAGVEAVKRYEKTTSDDLKVEIVVFCCNLVRQKQEYCHDFLQSGIVATCFRYLGEGSELLKQKTLLLIGNLSKHSSEAFDKFDHYHIVTCIYRCIKENKGNKKILKNTIYAVGNISYYSERFAGQIKPLIIYLVEGLLPEDDHLLINTISTISNLLRHTSVHMTTLIQTGIIKRIIDIFSDSNNADVVNYCCSLLRKAVAFPQFSKNFSKDSMRMILQINIRKGVLKIDNDSVKKLRMLL